MTSLVTFFDGRATLRLLPGLLGVLVLAGCTTSEALRRAPASPDQPWVAPVTVSASADDAAPTGYGVPLLGKLPPWENTVEINSAQPMSLPELIDLAQRENPLTRQAWYAAREAALSAGLVEATFLPMLSANVIAGRQRTSRPVDLLFGQQIDVDTTVKGVVPTLTLSWLLFDFGQRRALLEGAEQMSLAANVLFNGAHQMVIRNVTDHYYQYNTARARTRIDIEALANHEKVLEAAQARFDAGVGTTLDAAVARQGVAQARLQLVAARGLETNAYLALLAAVGLAPDTQLTVAEPPQQQLPGPSDPSTLETLQAALAQRPDVAAAYAALRATEAGVRAAEAAFMPKVFLGAVAAHNRANLDVRGLPDLSSESTSRGVLLGVRLPIYDGGLRRTQVQKAQVLQEQAAETLQSRQRDALREMVGAETLLRTALQSHEAADELVRTARVAYDGALDAYQHGVGTITLVSEATNALLKAQQARTDAYSASLVSAANLAFVMGAMIQPQDNWLNGRHP